MKKVRRILCGVLAVLMLAGCGTVQPEPENGQGGGVAVDLTRYAVKETVYPAYPEQPRYEDFAGKDGEIDWDGYDAAWEKYTAAMEEIGKLDAKSDSAAVTAFTEKTLGSIFTDSENRVYSPVSLYVALGMLTELADGDTKRQVMDLLGAADGESLRQTVHDLWLGVYTDDGRSVCRLANGAFLRENAEVKQAAVDTLADSYFASSYRVPMGTETANKAIASWLNRNTGGLLSEEAGNLRTDTDDLLRLYNTIYYKSSWWDAFESSDTKQDTFTAADGSKQTVDFMHRADDGGYRRGDDYTASYRRLRFGTMTFVLPDEGVTPESLLQREGFLTDLNGEYSAANVVWSLPKFDVKSSTDLSDILQSLGITDAFDGDKADFTPLTDSGAAVSGVMQAARVKIDEDGVEAAAYTEIVVADTAMMEQPPTVEMNLNRPFLFVIFNNDDVPLFIGTVQTLEA